MAKDDFKRDKMIRFVMREVGCDEETAAGIWDMMSKLGDMGFMPPGAPDAFLAMARKEFANTHIDKFDLDLLEWGELADQEYRENYGAKDDD